ncbi:MAG: hypothetical protein CTY35_00485 [Methylotenera sp.]|uniref:hypothetical protein n=1 Tax=Methylotenera sp. TaxID=2051956 RepID=UPI000D49DF94|nr:hypothetical protein [Methylotenera sp.]PPC84832.1 MAG: hypothetical protein CTY38_00480 [Methylotenera sp.]PPD02192.1 MAG: hypothetical protein CTY35_00485 [Methylotenera sp.]
MDRYTTLVIRMPEDEASLKKVKLLTDALMPFATGISTEDEMTILEKIEGHDNFDPNIAKDARKQTLALHKQLENNKQDNKPRT